MNSAMKSAIFLVAYFLIKLGYFLRLPKSILMPRKIVPYLGFLSDSFREVSLLIPEKKEKFLDLIEQPWHVQQSHSKASSVWWANVVLPGALLFTREMNNAISKAIRTSRPIKLHEALREENLTWAFSAHVG